MLKFIVRVWLAGLLVLVFMGRPALADNVLAVMYFDIKSDNASLQRLRVGLAEMITTDLAQVQGFKVVERKELAALLAEQDLGASGRIDQSTAVKIGKLLGAHYMVFGSGFDLFGSLRLDARVVNVETGAIEGTSSADGKLRDVLEMKGKLVKELSTWMAGKSGTGQAPGEVGEPAHASGPADGADPAAGTLAFAEGLEKLDAGDLAGAKVAFAKAEAADARLKNSVVHALRLADGASSIRGIARTAPKVEAVPKISEVYAKSHALVIGIDAYQSLTKLTGAVRDAKAMSKLLEGQGFQVTMLLNEQATLNEIKRQLMSELPKQVGENDRVLIYFAGHGVPEGEGSEQAGYLMPVEAAESWQGFEMTAVMDELRRRYKARHIIYMADACYSGLGLSSRSVPKSAAIPGYLRKVSQAEVQLQFTAGGKGQEAQEYTGRRGTHGLFTYHLLEGLEGKADLNDDLVVTSAELWVYLSQHVAETAERKNWDQTPQYGREGEGEFLFFLPQPG